MGGCLEDEIEIHMPIKVFMAQPNHYMEGEFAPRNTHTRKALLSLSLSHTPLLSLDTQLKK